MRKERPECDFVEVHTLSSIFLYRIIIFKLTGTKQYITSFIMVRNVSVIRKGRIGKMTGWGGNCDRWRMAH